MSAANDMSKHAFFATPCKGGTKRLEGWAGKCDECGRGPAHPIHDAGPVADESALIRAICGDN
jgi:hypothetical protein